MAIGDNKDITYFAQTDFRNKKVPFGIKSLDRARHFYIIGKTGFGKSTLGENMTIQDINNGNGVGYMDPHGASAELLLDYIPKDRIKDVIYFAPHDLDFPIAFNVMEDVGKDQRHLVANGLMAAFKKIWPDVWSARMEYISTNIILALLEYPDSTLLGINRMLSDKVYRKKVVDNVTDPVVKSFWVDEFAKYSDKLMVEAGASIQNKFGQFVSNPLIRNIVGQPKSTFNMRDVMDGKKILLMNLSKGRMGELNANLIGGMLITKLYLAAMSRASETRESLKKLPPFYFMVDEFQSFVNESFRDILSEARKYKLCLTLAHQYIEQIPEEVRDAVFGNVGTTVAFRVGPFDAEVLEKIFGPKFMAEDLVNLGFAQIYLTLMIDGVGSPPFSATTLPPIPKPENSNRDEVIDYSRKTYARPRADVEDAIKKWHEEQSDVKPYVPPAGAILIKPIVAGVASVASSYKPATPNRSFDKPQIKPVSNYKTPIRPFRPSVTQMPVFKTVPAPPVVQPVAQVVVKQEAVVVKQPERMSLSELTQKPSDNNLNKPKSTGRNMDELKNAIMEAMKSGKPKTDSTASKPAEPVQNKIPPPQVKKEIVKEVPEDVLRKILNTETNKGV